MGTSSLFVEFDEQNNIFTIPNTQFESPVLKDGSYSWELKITDSIDVVKALIAVRVFTPEYLFTSNSTQTNLTDTAEEEREVIKDLINKWHVNLMEKKA
jgi:hypothetical protein